MLSPSCLRNLARTVSLAEKVETLPIPDRKLFQRSPLVGDSRSQRLTNDRGLHRFADNLAIQDLSDRGQEFRWSKRVS